MRVMCRFYFTCIFVPACVGRLVLVNIIIRSHASGTDHLAGRNLKDPPVLCWGYKCHHCVFLVFNDDSRN